MPLVYFDASALVKLLVEEPGSDLAAELWDGCDAPLSSRLAYPEVCAALAAATRNHALTEAESDAAARSWEEFWATTRPIELNAAVQRYAGELARSCALRGADAVHLASALAVGDPELVVAVWDRRLHAGARSSGLRVAPAVLGDQR
jgi:predicted nucleic acid-binding protein